MYTAVEKRKIVQTVVARPDNAERFTPFLEEASQRGHKRGIRTIMVLAPLFAIPLFLVNAFIRPDRGTGVGAMISAGVSSLFLSFLFATLIGYVVMRLVRNKAQKQVDALIKEGIVVEIHPLLRKLWLEELERRGHKLTRKELGESLTARHEFFTSYRALAKQAEDPEATKADREDALTQLAKAMRTEGHRLPKPATAKN